MSAHEDGVVWKSQAQLWAEYQEAAYAEAAAHPGESITDRIIRHMREAEEAAANTSTEGA